VRVGSEARVTGDSVLTDRFVAVIESSRPGSIRTRPQAHARGFMPARPLSRAKTKSVPRGISNLPMENHKANLNIYVH